MRRARVFLFILILGLGFGGFAGNSFAVNPDEILENPVLEKRARDLSGEIRCMVCQNQSIDDSDATVARDLRILIRERIVAGDSDTQVRDYLVDRFGEFILLKPQFSWSNSVLWLTPLAVLIGAIAVAYWASRRRASSTARSASVNKLNKKEQGTLSRILADRE